ncbi:hypothetical protein V6C03_14310 [Methyloligella sp. 2.7D]|uniref:hypothetical protein n=1 Tax=unclassified Methyloligella TaxID=2625955 RepID=UPI00157BEBF4|nr:hypothetical protein [Methyloligella sp. GL2]QKP77072.1 hypothetical protein HT051_06155 [Methyloligella sp. GL2]
MPQLRIRRKLPVFLTLAGVAAGLVGVSALVGFGNLGSSLGESAWRSALDEPASHDAWPFETASGDNSKLRKLGFSAVLRPAPADERKLASLPGAALHDSASKEAVSLHKTAALTHDPRQDPHLIPDDVAIGDRVTLVTADGLSHSYRVTGREVADQTPALAAKQDRNAAALSCSNYDSLVAGAMRLVIEAVKVEADQAPRTEQKL